MGDNHTFDDSGLSERYPSGFDVHLPTEEIQSWSEGEGWERVQTSDRCIDAREQMYVCFAVNAFYCTMADNLQFWTTTHTPTRLGLKYPAFLSRKSTSWRWSF